MNSRVIILFIVLYSISTKEFKLDPEDDGVFLPTDKINFEDIVTYLDDSGKEVVLKGDGVCTEIVETDLIKTTPNNANEELRYEYNYYYGAKVAVPKCCDGWIQIDDFCFRQCTDDDTDCTEIPVSNYCKNPHGDGVCAEIAEARLIKYTTRISNEELWYDYSHYHTNVTVCKCCDGWTQVDNICVQLCVQDDTDCTEYEPDPSHCENLHGDGVCAHIDRSRLIKTTAVYFNEILGYEYSYYNANVTVCTCCDGWIQVDNFCVQHCTDDDPNCTEFVTDSSYCKNLQGDGVCSDIVETDRIKTTISLGNYKLWYDYSYYWANVTECKCCDGWIQVDDFCVKHCTEDETDCTEFVPNQSYCKNLQGDGVCTDIDQMEFIKTTISIGNDQLWYDYSYYFPNVTVCKCCDGWKQVDNFCVQQCAADDTNCTAFVPDSSYCENPQGDGVCIEIVEKEFIKTTTYIANDKLGHDYLSYYANVTVCTCCDGWIQVDNFCVQQCTEDVPDCIEYVPDPAYCEYPRGDGVCAEVVELTQVRNISYDQFVYKVEPYQANVTMCKCCEGWLQKGNLCVPECPSSCINGNCTSPDTCTCYDGYKQDDQYNFLCNKDCSSEGCSCENGYVLNEEKNICEPVCSTPCTDGICGNPEKCHCDVGYTDSGNPYICEPACSLPCTICLAPDTCGCTDGYTLDANGYTCNAICDPECVNGECVTPNVCECNYGYTSDNATENHCIPFCDICVYGDCVAPWECECWNGEPKKNGKCGPYCPDGCSNGTFCDDPGVCRCGNYYHLDENGNCELDCDLRCDQGQCVDEVCVCYDNYFGDRCDQSSANTVERTTKVVLFLMIFIIRYLTSN